MNDNLFICQICSKKVKNLNGLTQHIRKTHKLETKDYYDKYIKTNDEGICPCCGSITKFNKFGYRRFCSKRCNGMYTLQQTSENVDKRIEGIKNSENIKLSHNTKTFIEHQSKTRINYYKNEENRKKHKESLQNLPPRSKEYKELKSIQQSEIINTFKNLQHYYYNNEHFHSSWELAFYIYCKDHNYEITRKVDKIPYKFNEITYNYNPDFIVNGEIIEIKNQCLYSKLLIEGTKDNAKYQKMLEYKVKIITDCSKYVSYINTIYGEKYLEKFRRTKDVNE